MKIEEIMPLQGRYAARYKISRGRVPEDTPEDMEFAEWRTMEFVGLVDGEWVGLVMGDDGKLKTIHEIEGLDKIISVALSSVKTETEGDKDSYSKQESFLTRFVRRKKDD